MAVTAGREGSPRVIFGRDEMFRDTTDLTRRVTTKHLVMRKQKLPLQAKGGLATALLVAVTLASSALTAASGEQFCTHGGQNPVKGDSVACYSDAGCRFASSLGAEPVRDFSPSSAPFALARGKITGIVTSSSGLITQIRKAGGSCRRL
jgi:Asp/Glu/hydantoin racemase